MSIQSDSWSRKCCQCVAGEIIKCHQRIVIFHQAHGGLRILRFVSGNELVERSFGLVTGRRLPDLVQGALGVGLKRPLGIALSTLPVLCIQQR